MKNHNVVCECALSRAISELMRSVVPSTGKDHDRLMLVTLNQGECIETHRHAQHTVIYYPASTSNVLITPVAGMMVYLPPGTPHSVPRVPGDRISVAMLVDS